MKEPASHKARFSDPVRASSLRVEGPSRPEAAFEKSKLQDPLSQPKVDLLRHSGIRRRRISGIQKDQYLSGCGISSAVSGLVRHDDF
jgi:hypothetical protein